MSHCVTNSDLILNHELILGVSYDTSLPFVDKYKCVIITNGYVCKTRFIQS